MPRPIEHVKNQQKTKEFQSSNNQWDLHSTLIKNKICTKPLHKKVQNNITKHMRETQFLKEILGFDPNKGITLHFEGISFKQSQSKHNLK